jgi:hypothetical protein
MVILTKHSVVSSLPAGDADLKDAILTEIADEVDEAIEMVLAAALESLTARFPNVRFTILEN